MSTIELKKDLKRKIDLLSPSKFKKVYGTMVNTMNSQSDLDEWTTLSRGEKQAIKKGLQQAKLGKVNTHAEVMAELYKKFGPESFR